MLQTLAGTAERCSQANFPPWALFSQLVVATHLQILATKFMVCLVLLPMGITRTSYQTTAIMPWTFSQRLRGICFPRIVLLLDPTSFNLQESDPKDLQR